MTLLSLSTNFLSKVWSVLGTGFGICPIPFGIKLILAAGTALHPFIGHVTVECEQVVSSMGNGSFASHLSLKCR